MTTASEQRVDGRPPGADFLPDLGEQLRVLIVGGIPYGVLVAGVGSRLAMLLLRLTSPDAVSGVTSGIESDDGFTIGQMTFVAAPTTCCSWGPWSGSSARRPTDSSRPG